MYIVENFKVDFCKEDIERKLLDYFLERHDTFNFPLDEVIEYVANKENQKKFLNDIKKTMMPDVFNNYDWTGFFDKPIEVFKKVKIF